MTDTFLLPDYLDFKLTELGNLGDAYLTNQGHTPIPYHPMPKPIDLKVLPPHYVGRDIGGKPWYQGYYALEAHFNWKSWSQMEDLFAYYVVGHRSDPSDASSLDDDRAQVTVEFFDPYTGGYRTMKGWMHEPQVTKAQVHLYLDVLVRFSHLIDVVV